MVGRTSARSSRLAYLGLVAVLAAALLAPGVTTSAPPAIAASFTVTDPSGVDYDAACTPRNQRPGPLAPNSYASPGGTGCLTGLSTYDGSTEATDLRLVSLSTSSLGELVASFRVDGSLLFGGGFGINALDSPSQGAFLGARWRALFRNETRQTNVPTMPPTGGCITNLGTSVYDQHGSWKDGFHFFVGYAVDFDNSLMRWYQSAQIGEYDPSPGGGFRVKELGRNYGPGWYETDPAMVYGTHWLVMQPSPSAITVVVDGIARQANPVCGTGELNTVYYAPGDTLSSVKGLSTLVRAPGPKLGAEPCSPSSDDDCQASGPTFAEDDIVSDVTASNSTTGAMGRNLAGVAYTNGEDDSSDTKGPGPACPTPTYGGMTPPNPQFVPNSACHQDDDAFGRGTLYAEWWD